MTVSKNCFFLVFLFVISLPLSGCNQENQKLQAENAVLRSKLQVLEAELAKQPRELDRKAAEEILNRYLSTPSKKDVRFTKSGFELAKTDGIVIPNNPSKHWMEIKVYPWILSRKGIMLFRMIANKDDVNIKGEYIESNIQLAGKVVSIEGIADGPYPGTKVVQFIINYVFPPDVNQQDIAKYIYMEERKNAIFRRYDDGWRVEK